MDVHAGQRHALDFRGHDHAADAVGARGLQGSTIFAFFAAMMVLQLLFVVFLMPETKGRTLESLAEGLSRHEHARDGNRG
jgi:hypothetical protein